MSTKFTQSKMRTCADCDSIQPHNLGRCIKCNPEASRVGGGD